MAFVRDATALERTATLEPARHSVKLAKGQANASRAKGGAGNQSGFLRGLTACSPMTNRLRSLSVVTLSREPKVPAV